MRYHARPAGYWYRDRLNLIGNPGILKIAGNRVITNYMGFTN